MKILVEKEEVKLILEHKGNKVVRFTTIKDATSHDIDVDVEELNKAISFLTSNPLGMIAHDPSRRT